MDVGAYCKGIEYATGVKARIVGKPSKEYFLKAVDALGFKPEEVKVQICLKITFVAFI